MVRLKNRYIVVQINRQDCNEKESRPFKIHQVAVYNSIQNKVQQLHGDFGIAAIQAGFQAKYTNEITRIAIIRCRHGPHKLVTSAIPFITLVDSYNVSFDILYIGATIKQCFSFVKLYQERKCDEICAQLHSEDAKQSTKDVLLNFESVLNALQN